MQKTRLSIKFITEMWLLIRQCTRLELRQVWKVKDRSLFISFLLCPLIAVGSCACGLSDIKQCCQVGYRINKTTIKDPL